MTLTAKDVSEIMRILNDSSFDTLSLEMDGVKLHLERATQSVACHREEAQAEAEPGRTSALVRERAKPKPPSEAGLLEIPSPLLGIFHRAPKPGAAPFVEVGSKLEPETVIGIIEVMKLMNSVRAGVKGEVVEILIENGSAVEYGEILMRIRS
ncbi:MAG: acetyl-CoA carboxylase, biotin carboxyl carrier protein [Acidobacteria bacterium]|nr:acetyl-CoA carboxylase, biotin carboxyl carrier protein [Acidobacteriota bacterium]